MTRDTALGLLLLALAAGYYALAAAIPAGDLSDAVGPAGLPKVYAVVLAVLALTLIARSIRARALAAGPPVTRRQLARAGGMLAIGAVYIAIIPFTGYLLTMAGLLVGTAYYQGGRLDRRVLLVGVIGAAVLWVVFVQVLGVDHPRGLWLDRLLGPS